MHRWFFGFMLVVTGLLASTTIVAAEEPGEGRDGPGPIETRVVRIVHTSAFDVLEVVRELLDDSDVSLAQLGGTNSVIVQGPDLAVARVHRLIAQLDQAMIDGHEDDPDEDGPQTRFVPVESYPMHELLGVIDPFVDESCVRFAVDEVNHNLILSGEPRHVGELVEIVRALDRPKESWTVSISFVRASLAGDEEPVSGDLPAPLAPAVEKLREAGFSGFRLLAPIVVQVNSGESFAQEFTRVFKVDGTKEHLKFRVQGRAEFDTGSDRVSLEMGAMMSGSVYEDIEGRRVGSSEFEVETTLTAALDRSVVLSAAPSSTSQGEAVAVVVRVTRE